jgi:hypothetical protein
VLCSGVAKLRWGGIAWMQPNTMRAYLTMYSTSKSNPPLSRALNRAIVARPWATSLIGVATIGLECLLVPACLAFPPEARLLGASAMVTMHLGIAACMSLKVGLAFVTTLPCYLVGFSCSAAVGSAQWVLAAAVGVVPSLLSVASERSIPDEWPLTPFTLFMFNGSAAEAIADRLMTGNTRIVLTALAHGTSTGPDDTVVGRRVVPHGLLLPTETTAMGGGKPHSHPYGLAHDVVLRAIAFTTVHADLHAQLASNNWDMPALLEHLTLWLRRERRLIESSSGLPLLRAHFVRINLSDNKVVEVLTDCHTTR